ncbi:MAG: DeoR/GlpR family DNA-binding transcription regulator [Opitutales bacterium]
MQQARRQQLIEEYLHEVEIASLEELAAKVGASVSTVRRDVGSLAETGRIKRTHGGARIIHPEREEFVFSSRERVEQEAKQRLGRACAELIGPNQNLFVDAGSTAFTVACHLEVKSPHIVTNSLSVANHFASHPGVEVVVSGGVVYPRLQVMVGPLATHAFTSLRADIAIMGGGGATGEGIMNSHLLLVETQQAMMNSAQRVIFCLDHTKIGRSSFAPLCGWERVDTLVTNEEAEGRILEAIRARGVRVVVC